MPIEKFDNNTFVAVMDIPGFKKLIDEDKALNALDNFYKHGYAAIEKFKYIIGLFTFNSCTLFINNDKFFLKDDAEYLTSLLDIVKEINKKMLNDGIMLTATIAYGHFKYKNRVEFGRIEQNQFYGNAYIKAFLDNEYSEPKIRPGECRILTETLPPTIKKLLYGKERLKGPLGSLQKHQKYHYFYWMVK